MEDEIRYPAMEIPLRDSRQPILGRDGAAIASLADYWQWAHSDLMSNTERGVIAEYLVACALGLQGAARAAWRRFDLQTPDGTAIEVKSSGYLQAWGQRTLSEIVFGIPQTLGWDETRNCYDTVRKRQAALYVFCVHHHKDPQTVNVLDTVQWSFYPAATETIDRCFGTQKTVSLTALQKHGISACSFEALRDRLLSLTSPARA